MTSVSTKQSHSEEGPFHQSTQLTVCKMSNTKIRPFHQSAQLTVHKISKTKAVPIKCDKDLTESDSVEYDTDVGSDKGIIKNKNYVSKTVRFGEESVNSRLDKKADQDVYDLVLSCDENQIKTHTTSQFFEDKILELKNLNEMQSYSVKSKIVLFCKNENSQILKSEDEEYYEEIKNEGVYYDDIKYEDEEKQYEEIENIEYPDNVYSKKLNDIEESYTCKFCDKMFKTLFNLNLHTSLYSLKS